MAIVWHGFIPLVLGLLPVFDISLQPCVSEQHSSDVFVLMHCVTIMLYTVYIKSML